MFSLARTLPSPASAEDKSSLFDWFIGTMVRSDSSRACMSDVRLCAFPDRPRSLNNRGAPEVSRFSCMLFLSVRRFSDYAGFNRPLACNATGHIAFLHTVRESASCSATFRSSIARPTDTPVYASTNTSRCQPQDSGPRWIRFLLSCRTLSFPTTCRFIPALDGLSANRRCERLTLPGYGVERNIPLPDRAAFAFAKAP